MSEGEGIETGQNASQVNIKPDSGAQEPRVHSMEEKRNVLNGVLRAVTALNDPKAIAKDTGRLKQIADQMQKLGVDPSWFSADQLMNEFSGARQRLSRTTNLTPQQVEEWMLRGADFTQPADSPANREAFRTQADRALEVVERTGMLEERPLNTIKGSSGEDVAVRTFRIPGSRPTSGGNSVREK